MKAGGRLLDKATDKIKPIKAAKDKVKGAVRSVKALKDKAVQGVKTAAKNGLKGAGKAAVHGIKAGASFLASHPVVAVILIVVILLLASIGGDGDSAVEESSGAALSDDEVVSILMDDCVEQQYDVMGELNAEEETLAQSIYGVFRTYGFNNASIAGILGNIDAESGLDPSAIEGIFDEYGFLGARKGQAIASLPHYTENVLFPSYNESGISYNQDGYKFVDDSGETFYYCGIGLIQWTGPNAVTLLRAAETTGHAWYDMDFQLSYMRTDSLYRPGFFTEWKDNQYEGEDDDDDGVDSDGDGLDADGEDDEESWKEAARDSAVYFAHNYEGNTSDDENRKNAAATWYDTIKDWGDEEVDNAAVDSIVQMASELGTITEFLDLEEIRHRCVNANLYDNSSIANAAVSFAWPTRDQSYNDGTSLYQIVVNNTLGRGRYKDCGYCVASAVRWSGSDDTYPVGTSEQLRYLNSSSKWEFVGAANLLSKDDLVPGDIFVLAGHTFIYTGEEAISGAYGDEATAGADSVSASLNERSAGCDTSTTSILARNGDDWEGRGIYQVFRCSNPDNSDRYTSIGSGVDGSGAETNP